MTAVGRLKPAALDYGVSDTCVCQHARTLGREQQPRSSVYCPRRFSAGSRSARPPDGTHRLLLGILRDRTEPLALPPTSPDRKLP